LGAHRSRPYRYVDAALLRATAHTGTAARPPWPGLEAEAEVERWCGWLAQVWSRASVAESLSIASPVLAARVEAVCAGHRPRAGRLRRMMLSLARYLVRMDGRATPFGTFAGVAPLRFGAEPSVRWTGTQHRRTTADVAWLAAVIARLESYPALRRRLPVMVNDLVFVRGERLVVPWQPHTGDPDRSALAEVSVRHGPIVQKITNMAREPLPAGDLIDDLVTEFPAVTVAAIDAVVARLVTCGVLITGMRPSATCVDGLAHVLGRLHDVRADSVEEVAPVATELRAIHARMRAADRSAGPCDRRAVADRMRALSAATAQPLMVDVRFGGTFVLPAEVAVEAESAAGALLRLNPHPAGEPAWRKYHIMFLERYGAGALVPVGRLVDPTAGLGFPAHYGRPRRPAADFAHRDRRLLALAQQAAMDGACEIVLDEAAIEDLAAGGPDRPRSVPHADLLAEVCAPTLGALAAGAFTLVVRGIGRTAFGLTGRFLDILPSGDRRRMLRMYGGLPTAVDGAVRAQLTFPARHPGAQNLTRIPLLSPEVIALAEHRSRAAGSSAPRHIPLEDLAVTADNDRMYLVSLARRRVVEPALTNTVAWEAMPSIARLLFEIPCARAAAVSPFSWGAASSLPFLPRVRHCRSVLAPAQWRIPAGALPGSAATRREWTRAMAALRDRLRLPPHVSVGEVDRRLRLDLDEPMDLDLLRAHLDGARGAAVVSEAAGPSEHGWFGQRAHEIVIPLASTTPAVRVPDVVTAPGPLPLIEREHGRLPGSDVLFAKLYGHPDGFAPILVDHLPDLLAAWDEPPRWWFVRYADPRPHLRLRLHLAGGHEYGRAASRVGAWAAGLRRRGLVGDLVLDTYHPETARYGPGPALAAAEAVFAADSAAAVAQLAAMAASRRTHPYALTAASLADLAAALTGSVPAGMRWLIEHPPAGRAPGYGREVVGQALAMTNMTVQGTDVADVGADGTGPSVRPAGEDTPHTIPGGGRIAAAWQARQRAAAAYADRLAGGSYPTRPSVFASLLHMHHVRVHGPDRDAERGYHRIARAVALTWTARHQGRPW
jgi:thiopeptide-type bacteriocin biosynthesis protein